MDAKVGARGSTDEGSRLQAIIRLYELAEEPLATVLDYALEEALALTGSTVGYIYTFDESTRQFTLYSWSKHVMDSCSVVEKQTVYDLDKTGIWGEAVRQRRTILVNDFQAPNPLKKGYPEGHVALRNFLTVPVFLMGKAVAVVGLGNRPGDYTRADVEQLELFIKGVWNIVARKQAEEAMQALHDLERLQLIMDSIPLPVYYEDAEGVYQGCNKAFETLVGVSKQGIVGRRREDIFQPEFAARLERYARDTLRERSALSVEDSFTDRSGLRKDVLLRKTPYGDGPGGALGLIGVMSDVTVRKRAEEALRASEERFRKAIENAPVPIIIHSEDGRVLSLSRAWTEITGYSPEDIPTLEDWTTRAFGDKGPDVLAYVASVFAHEGPMAHGEYAVTCADGSRRVWDFSSAPLGRQNDGLRTMIGMASDVTARRESEELLRKILMGVKAGILIIDPKTRLIQDINSVAEEIVGIPREELIGQPCSRIGWRYGQSGKSGRPVGACPLMEGNIQNTEYYVERPDGRTIPIMKTVISAFSGQRMLLYEILFDFSERKALERQLALAQRLESIGGLAAGIAHEINTPIQYVGDNLSFLEEAFSGLVAEAGKQRQASAPDGEGDDLGFLIEEVPKALAQSREGVARVAEIVRAMKRFSHMGGEEKTLLDVPAAIENTLMISRNEWKYHAEVRLDLDPEARFLPCFPADFNQVLLNILVNASHAIAEKRKGEGEKGTITLSTRREGGWFTLKVSDTGCGIPEKNLHRIFDPFFTTKEVGKGTGQGLALCHDAVVKKHGGSIDVASAPGVGTTFTLRFPLEGKGDAAS